MIQRAVVRQKRLCPLAVDPARIRPYFPPQVGAGCPPQTALSRRHTNRPTPSKAHVPETATAPDITGRPDGPVAQLVEHLTFNQVVTGSTPVGLTKFSLNYK